MGGALAAAAAGLLSTHGHAAFHEHMPKLFPARDFKSVFGSMPAPMRSQMAATNATLQGDYLILAARALGLDCGPLAGFDNAKVDEAFGYGDGAKQFPRNPRLDFAESARIDWARD